MKKLLLGITFLVLLSPLYADAAMPPTNVHVKYNGSDVKDDFYAAVLGCYSSDVLSEMRNQTQIQHPSLLIEEYDSSRNCTWYPASGLGEEVGCSNSLCRFYPSTSPFKLAVYIPSMNRTFVSGAENIFGGEFIMNISSSGEVSIGKAPAGPSLTASDEVTLIAGALILTLVVELATSFMYLRARKLSKEILWSIVLANVISVPLLWLFLLAVGYDEFLLCLSLLGGEFAVFVFEAVVIFLLNRKRMDMADAFAMSLINNLASFVAGIVVVILVGVL